MTGPLSSSNGTLQPMTTPNLCSEIMTWFQENIFKGCGVQAAGMHACASIGGLITYSGSHPGSTPEPREHILVDFSKSRCPTSFIPRDADPGHLVTVKQSALECLPGDDLQPV